MMTHTGLRFIPFCIIAVTPEPAVLPQHVSELLKDGTAVEDVLEEYPEITILFCYITGFKELTTSCDPYDVVDFVNSLFSSFDKVR